MVVVVPAAQVRVPLSGQLLAVTVGQTQAQMWATQWGPCGAGAVLLQTSVSTSYHEREATTVCPIIQLNIRQSFLNISTFLHSSRLICKFKICKIKYETLNAVRM